MAYFYSSFFFLSSSWKNTQASLCDPMVFWFGVFLKNIMHYVS